MVIPNLFIYLFGATTLEYVQFPFSVLVAKINPNWKHFSGEKRYTERLSAPSPFLHYWSIMPLSLTALSVSLEHSGHLGRATEQFMTHFWTRLKGDWVLESVVEDDGMPYAPLDCRGLAGAHASPASNGEQSGEKRNLWTTMWQLVCPNWCESASLRGFFPAFSPTLARTA